jgi:hypothetical protein
MSKKTPKYALVDGQAHRLKLGGKGKAVTVCGFHPEKEKGYRLTPTRPKSMLCRTCFFGGEL